MFGGEENESSFSPILLTFMIEFSYSDIINLTFKAHKFSKICCSFSMKRAAFTFFFKLVFSYTKQSSGGSIDQTIGEKKKRIKPPQDFFCLEKREGRERED